MARSMAFSRTLLVIVALWCQVGPVRGASSGVTICSCDLSPGNCDLNCCCDPDCSLSDPTSVFSSCLPGSTKAERLVCLYNWLIFRNNTPYTTKQVGSPPTQLFCVLSDDASLNYFVTPRTVDASNFLSVSQPYKGSSFSVPSESVPVFSSFYKAGDPVLTVSASNALSVLRQPAPVGAQNICSDNNPAKFLQSGSTLCLRMFSNLTDSCETELSLDPLHYYQDIAVLRVPPDVSGQGASTVRGRGGWMGHGMVPVSSSVTARPVVQGDQCNNVVSQVIYTVLYNGTQGITNVSVDFILGNVPTTSPSIQQNTTVIYKPVTSTAGSSVQTRSGNPGYLVGYPVLANTGHLMLPRALAGETCSSSPVQFGMSALGGCTIRGTAQESCSFFQDRAYRILHGGDAPHSLAIYGNVTGAQSNDLPQIISQNCSAQVPLARCCRRGGHIWARVGLISNPQAQLLHARFIYTCQSVKCEDTTVLQARVSFTDLTRQGPAPRSSPGINGKDPMDFFFPFQTNTAVMNASSLLLCMVLCCWLIMQ
ncbi:PREDICTED: tectonic-3-like [Nanorana parkeri]|uniref:tectonic-3-like n=1 Tax=Nanorana parkeri TaxID=125878 RepID=UPI0008549404|nr:PREDICTED: tectonic-3-like [Nanorana parkeri]